MCEPPRLNPIFMSGCLPCFISLPKELCTLTHLLLYHADWSESGNRLATPAIFMENTMILFNRLRRSSKKPLGKT